MIGHEKDQAKNEAAVGKLSNSIRQWEREAIENYREQEKRLFPTKARIGDLAIIRGWPYRDRYRVCYVTRVDKDGQPTHLRDGAGVRFSDAPTAKGATIMPDTFIIVSRGMLIVPARQIAAANHNAHFSGVDLQSICERIVGQYMRPEAS